MRAFMDVCVYTFIRIILFFIVLTLCYCPDGSQLAVATLDGVITLWDTKRSVIQYY